MMTIWNKRIRFVLVSRIIVTRSIIIIIITIQITTTIIERLKIWFGRQKETLEGKPSLYDGFRNFSES